MKLILTILLVLTPSLQAEDDHGTKKNPPKSLSTLGEPPPELRLDSMKVGDEAVIAGVKVSRTSKEKYSICEGDSCTGNLKKDDVLLKLGQGKLGMRGLFGAHSAPPSALPMNPSAREPASLGQPLTGTAGPKNIGNDAAYQKARKEETADFVVMTYSDKSNCPACRALYGEGQVRKGDPAVAKENTLAEMAKNAQGKVSYYVMDLRDPEIHQMFSNLKVGNSIPYTAVYRRTADGELEPLQKGGGPGAHWPGQNIKTLTK